MPTLEQAPMDRHLIIFTRYPEAHTTKTRLIPALGPEGAAALQYEMTLHTLRWVGRLRGDLALSVEVRFEGGDEVRMRDRFGNGFFYRPQGPGDLGCRMARAVQEGCRSGARRTVVMGTDCPDLSPQLVLTAFDRLMTHDLVLGPATDGGYYLIGLCRPDSDLFSDIHWGTEHVLYDTLARAQQLSLSVSQLETLSDVDRPEDIAVWQRARKVGV
ncbi:MAG: TIGR04282 family arsenosugar biosynthesis glycosyltransferase [Pirellulaceae bacterium]